MRNSRWTAVLLREYWSEESFHWRKIFVRRKRERDDWYWALRWSSILVNHWFGQSLEHKIILPVLDRRQGIADECHTSISFNTFLSLRIECLHNIDQDDADIWFVREQYARHSCERHRVTSSINIIYIHMADDLSQWQNSSTSAQFIGNASDRVSKGSRRFLSRFSWQYGRQSGKARLNKTTWGVDAFYHWSNTVDQITRVKARLLSTSTVVIQWDCAWMEIRDTFYQRSYW